MADELDVDAMIARFRERAAAVRDRPLPPVAGADRQRFVEQAQRDFQDFAIIGDATWDFTDGILTLRVDLSRAELLVELLVPVEVLEERAVDGDPHASWRTGSRTIGTRIISGTSIASNGTTGTLGDGERERDHRRRRRTPRRRRRC